ncbi:MAG: hypothetical protein ABJC10_05470 [Acidobacteriota bacterium]
MTQQNSFAVFINSNATRGLMMFFLIMLVVLLITVSTAFTATVVRAQAQTPPRNAGKPPAKKKFKLRVTREGVIGVSLKAEKTKMSELVAELSKRLGVKVMLGPGLAKEAITVEFYDLTLEPAMRLLAPRVFIDYEIRADAPAKPLGIMLLGCDDPDPAKNAIVESTSQALLIEGNTEEGETTEVGRDDPLQIELDDNSLTVKSKQQRLQLVVMQIADLLGVPAGIDYDSNEIVDLEIKDTPFEEAIPRLSPNVRLYVRADLTKSRRVPLRLAIVPPQTKTEVQ